MTGQERDRARWWGVAAMVAIAAVAAVLSYFDGLFVARLAGNHDWRAWLYPLLPDELIVICLIALLAARRRPAWATCGLVLGIGLTLAMNVGAGMAHSVLDAVVDGFVPVVFFVAVEVFIGYVRRGRGGSPEADPLTVPATSRRSIPSGNFEAAKASMRETVEAGNPWSRNQLQARFRLSRSEADEIWQPYKPPAGESAQAPAPAPAGALGGRDGPSGGSTPAAAVPPPAVPATPVSEQPARRREEVMSMAGKSNIAAWLQQAAQNDADYGRDSKDNPNNKPNGSGPHG